MMKMQSSSLLLVLVVVLMLGVTTVSAHVVRTDPPLPARGGDYTIMLEGQADVKKPMDSNGCVCQPGSEPVLTHHVNNAMGMCTYPSARIFSQHSVGAAQQVDLVGSAAGTDVTASTGTTSNTKFNFPKCRCELKGRYFAPAGPTGGNYNKVARRCGNQAASTMGEMYVGDSVSVYLDMTNAEVAHPVPVPGSGGANPHMPAGAKPCGGVAQKTCANKFVCVDVENDGCDNNLGHFDCDGYCRYNGNVPVQNPITGPTDVKITLQDVINSCMEQNKAHLGSALKGILAGVTNQNTGSVATPGINWEGQPNNVGNMVGEIIDQKLMGGQDGNVNVGTIVAGCVNGSVIKQDGLGNLIGNVIGKDKEVLGMNLGDLIGDVLGDLNHPSSAGAGGSGNAIGTAITSIIGGGNASGGGGKLDIGAILGGLFGKKRRLARRRNLLTLTQQQMFEARQQEALRREQMRVNNPTQYYNSNANWATPQQLPTNDHYYRRTATAGCKCPSNWQIADPVANSCTIAGELPVGGTAGTHPGVIPMQAAKSAQHEDPDTAMCRCKPIGNGQDSSDPRVTGGFGGADITTKDQPAVACVPGAAVVVNQNSGFNSAPCFTPREPRGAFSLHLACAGDKSELSAQVVALSRRSGNDIPWGTIMSRQIYLETTGKLGKPLACTIGVFYNTNNNGVCFDFMLLNPPAAPNIPANPAPPLTGFPVTDNQGQNSGGNNNAQNGGNPYNSDLINSGNRPPVNTGKTKKSKAILSTGMLIGLIVAGVALLGTFCTVAYIKSTKRNPYAIDYQSNFMGGNMDLGRRFSQDSYMVNPIRSF